MSTLERCLKVQATYETYRYWMDTYYERVKLSQKYYDKWSAAKVASLWYSEKFHWGKDGEKAVASEALKKLEKVAKQYRDKHEYWETRANDAFLFSDIYFNEWIG